MRSTCTLLRRPPPAWGWTVVVGSTPFTDLGRGFQTEALDDVSPAGQVGADVDLDADLGDEEELSDDDSE
jgi:hypothetical protein